MTDLINIKAKDEKLYVSAIFDYFPKIALFIFAWELSDNATENKFYQYRLWLVLFIMHGVKYQVENRKQKLEAVPID